MTPWARLKSYCAHPDPATAAANTVALIVGWNTPFYPLYVIAIAGSGVSGPAMLTLAACPAFLAVPALARRSPRAGRFALPTIGTVNTLWCTKLLGTACSLELFLIPCILLASLLDRPAERPLLLTAAALPIAAYFTPARLFGTPIVGLSPDAEHGLAVLNECSVVFLCFVLAWQFANARQPTAR